MMMMMMKCMTEQTIEPNRRIEGKKTRAYVFFPCFSFFFPSSPILGIIPLLVIRAPALKYSTPHVLRLCNTLIYIFYFVWSCAMPALLHPTVSLFVIHVLT